MLFAIILKLKNAILNLNADTHEIIRSASDYTQIRE